jgi:hypothetical protein
MKKEGNVYKEFTTSNCVSGCVSNLAINEFMFEGKKKKSYKLILIDSDAGQKYSIDISESNNGRNILNSILSMKEFLSPIEISVYFKKSKKDNKDYPSVSVRYLQTEEFVPWAFPIADINAKIVETKNEDGETIRNYKKVNTFFEEQVRLFIEKNNFYVKKKETPKEEKKILPPEKDDAAIDGPPFESDEDMPF